MRPNYHKLKISFTLVFFTVMVVLFSGCGQAGDLYLPKSASNNFIHAAPHHHD